MKAVRQILDSSFAKREGYHYVAAAEAADFLIFNAGSISLSALL